MATSSAIQTDAVSKAITSRLTSVERINAIEKLQAGTVQQAVARHFGVSRRTISAPWTDTSVKVLITGQGQVVTPETTTTATHIPRATQNFSLVSS